MKKHTKIYLKAFGLSEGEYIPCEITGLPSGPPHHIENRGSGGDPTGSKDRIENLMALTLERHEALGERKDKMAYLFKVHLQRMVDHGVKFDRKFIESKIKYYESINAVSNDLAAVLD